MSLGDLIAGGSAPESPGWMEIAVWPFLVIVAVYTWIKGS